MPVSPEMAEDLARQVRDLYEAAELSLLERLARALAADLESPLWAELKLRAVGDLRRAVEEVATALKQDADGAIRQSLTTAYERGQQAAVAELGTLPIGEELAARRAVPNAAAVDRLAASAAADTRPVYARITRAVLDAFRTVITRVTAGPLLGTESRRQASQRALDQFAARGITGFVDRAGRSWNMASYAEMAVRSVTARAAIEGHTDSLRAIGVGLVIVSDSPLECPLCRPYEGEVLALGGPPGPRTVMAEHATDRGGLLRRPRPVSVHVVGTLLKARAAGLFHPNCRHSLSAYLPGVTTRPQAPPHPRGTTYEDTQQQRYLERQVRAWKRRQAAALDEHARRRAGARVREYQTRIRELTDETGLPRKRQREQIGAAR
ncbi:phage minor capsid protein [Streptomyces sp. NPDC000941]